MGGAPGEGQEPLLGFGLLPTTLQPPVPSTNLPPLGYSFDASTSPASLSLIHVHSGRQAGGARAGAGLSPSPARV